MYLISPPWLLRKIYPSCIWDLKSSEKIIYLTFDDGPHEVATPFVLEQLRNYGAKATFFCIGKNVRENPELYSRIIQEGHITGNHTYHHLNGWKTPNEKYIKDILDAKALISSHLFRPPYGRISKSQLSLMKEIDKEYKTIMWSVLSGDFDLNLTGEKCLSNVIRYTKRGSIVVFHDSSKAFSRLEYALPKVLDYYSQKGFVFKSINIDHDLN